MKSSVEAGHLRNVGSRRGNRTNCSNVMRLMQRRERNERLQRRYDRIVDQDRRRVVKAAMHHAMSDTGKRRQAADMRDKPALNRGHRAVMIVSGDGFVDRRSARRIGDFEARGGTRVRSDAIDLSMSDG